MKKTAIFRMHSTEQNKPFTEPAWRRDVIMMVLYRFDCDGEIVKEMKIRIDKQIAIHFVFDYFFVR